MSVAPPAVRKSKRRLWIILGSAATVILLLVGTGVVLQGYFADQQAKRDAAYDVAEDKLNPIKQEEIDALLAGQTKALKDRDEKAFLAAYDPTNNSLVEQQTALFRNLIKVPFAEAIFRRLGGGSAFTPLGTGASVNHSVAFVHKLDGYDLHAVSEEYTWTIARTEQAAPIKVTSVEGLTPDKARYNYSYYPAPWDKWRDIHVERTEHTLFIVDASLKAQAQQYAPQAERAAVANLAAWRAGGVSGEIPQGFVISFVKGKKDLGSLYRLAKETPPEAGYSLGVARFEEPDPAAPAGEKPSIVGGSRVVIDVATGFFDPSEPNGPGEIFRHELAHSIVAALTDRQSDTAAVQSSEWLVEGFAEYLGNEQRPWTASPRTPGVKELLRTGHFLGLKDEFDLTDAESADLAYWCGHSAVGYMAEKYGQKKTFEVVAEYYRGKAVKDVMPQVLGVSYADFKVAWEAYVKAKIR